MRTDPYLLLRLQTKLDHLRAQRIHCRERIVFQRIPFTVSPDPIPSSRREGDIHGELTLGDCWGEPERTYTFRFDIHCPPAFRGHEVRFRAVPGLTGRFNQSGCEGLLSRDGHVVQGMDGFHPEAVLFDTSFGNERCTLCLSVWTGTTGATDSYATTWVGQYRFQEAEVFSVDRPGLEYLRTYRCLLGVVRTLADEDPRKQLIIEALLQSLAALGVCTPGTPLFRERVDTANHVLNESLPQHDASGVQVTAVGHAHIDVGWLWPVRHVRGKVIRTMATVTELLRRYPAFVHFHSQPLLLELLQSDAPALWETVVAAIRAGRIELDGGTWVEPDCNIPSGESLVRHFLYGAACARAFGAARQEVLWLPDCFGFPHSLPQIARSAGLRFFVTSKLSWNERHRPEYDTFRWRGLDGSELLGYFLTTPQGDRATYNGLLAPEEVHGAWANYHQKDINSCILFAFGRGDGGGGPDEEMVEAIERISRFSSRYRTRPGSVRGFLRELADRTGADPRLPVIDGELYLEKHRGTFTSQAAVKKLNRACEVLLMEAEQLACMCSTLGLGTYPHADLERPWKRLLTNQFHDIITGTSCPQVYEEATREYAAIQRECEGTIARSITALTRPSDGAVSCYSGCSFPRSGPVLLPDGDEDLLEGKQGTCHALQKVRTTDGPRRIAFVGTEGIGFSPFRLRKASFPSPEAHLRTSRSTLENRFVRVELDDEGTIGSIVDKIMKREVLAGKGNHLLLFEDKPYAQDAWTIDPGYERVWAEWLTLEETTLEEDGPVRAVVRQRRTFEGSSVEQRLILYCDSPLVVIATTIDWQQRNTMLKSSFPLNLESKAAAFEIQFGHTYRPVTRNNSIEAARYEVVAHRFVDMSEANWGVALINDCKYGHDVLGNRIRLTLLRSPSYPDPEADRGHHEFSYALYPHQGDLNHSDVVQTAIGFNQPMRATPHVTPTVGAFLAVEPSSAIVTALKGAEDGSGTIVRLYQSLPQRDRVRVRLCREILRLEEVNLLEETDPEPPTRTEVSGSQFRFEIRPFQIRSFRILVAGMP